MGTEVIKTYLNENNANPHSVLGSGYTKKIVSAHHLHNKDNQVPLLSKPTGKVSDVLEAQQMQPAKLRGRGKKGSYAPKLSRAHRVDLSLIHI